MRGLRGLLSTLIASAAADPKSLFPDSVLSECTRIRTPHIVTSGSNWWHVSATCCMGGHVEDNARMVMAVSSDNGKTWKHQFPAGDPKGVRGSNMIYDRVTKNLVLQYHTIEDSKLYQVMTPDHGHHWSKPVEIKLDHCKVTGETAGQRIQTSTGRLLWYGGGADSGKYPPCIWYSDDHGKTYHSKVSPGPSNEVSFALTSTSQIYANGRAVVGKWQPNRIDYRSDDNGLTWTKTKSTLTEPEAGQECERGLVYNPGNGIMYTSEPKGNKDHPRADLETKCSKNNGKVWHNSSIVGGDDVAGYSSIGPLADGTILIVWDYDSNYLGNKTGDSHGQIRYQHITGPC
jgi:hypothetical protein